MRLNEKKMVRAFNDMSWSSFVITIFLAKFLISFILLFSFVGIENSWYLMGNPGAIDGTFQLSTEEAEYDGIKIEFGEIAPDGISESTSNWDRVKGLIKFAFTPSLLKSFLEIKFNLDIPYIIWLFLFDIWTILLLPLMFVRIFLKG